MLKFRDVFMGTGEIDKKFNEYVDSAFLANPGYSYCLDYVFNNVTRKDYFARKLSISLPTIVNSTVSDDARTITVECEPRENTDLIGADESRMIRRGIISITQNGSIKVSEVTATSLNYDEFKKIAYPQIDLSEEPTGPIVYLCQRASFVVNALGEIVAKSSGTDSYSKDFQDDEELRKMVDKSYDDTLHIISQPVNVVADTSEMRAYQAQRK